MSEQSEAADRFEEKIRTLLRNLGFSHVNGGRNFVIGGEQIDAIGVFEGKTFIIECTIQKSAHKAKTQPIPTKKGPIRDELQRTPKYSTEKYYFLYVVGNNSLEEGKKKEYEKKYEIKILALEDVHYYENLAKRIPSRAPYDFLSQLDITANSQKGFQVPALMHKVGTKTIYSFFADPNDIIRISYVARREVMRQVNYQRMIDSTRLKKIHEYLQDGKRFIPTNVVLAINKKATFKPIESDTLNNKYLKVGMLTLPSDYDACLVIDGQHRLFSYTKGLKQNLSFVAFDHITLEEQMSQFVVINQNAKPIGPNLMWDLQSDLDTNGAKGRISLIAKKLNDYEPFRGKIKVSDSGHEKISLSAICIALEKTKLAEALIKDPTGKSTVKNRYFDNDSARFAHKLTVAIANYFMEFKINAANAHVVNFGISQGGTTVLLYLIRILEYEKADGKLQHDPKHSLGLLAKNLSTLSDTLVDEYRKVAATSEANKSKILNVLLSMLTGVEPILRRHISDDSGGLLELQGECEDLMIEFLDKNIDKPALPYLKKWFKHSLTNIERKLPGHYSSKDFLTKLSIAEKFQALIILLKAKPQLKFYFLRIETDSIADTDQRFRDLKELETAALYLVSLRNRNDMIHTQLPSEKITDPEKTIAAINYRQLIACLNTSLVEG